MPSLEALHLSLVPGIDIASTTTVAGRIWEATLQYIMHQDCVRSCHVSQQTERDQVWVFLTWCDEELAEDEEEEDEDGAAKARRSFYGFSLGVGMMLHFLVKPPEIYTLKSATEGKAPVYIRHGKQVLAHLYTFSHFPSPEEKSHLELCRWQDPPHGFEMSGWETDATPRTWPKTFTDAISFLALTSSNTDDIPSDTRNIIAPLNPPPEHDSQITLILRTVTKDIYPTEPTFSLPNSTADLFHTPPWLYGLTPYDESEFGRDAQPHGVDFRPMATLRMDSWFLYDRPSSEPPESTQDDAQYYMSILKVHFTVHEVEQRDNSGFGGLCRMIGLQSGLQEFYWGRDGSDSRIVRFYILWNSLSAATAFESTITASDTELKAASPPQISRDSTLICVPTHSTLNWDEDGIVELLDFEFTGGIQGPEKQAFEMSLGTFIGKMYPSFSHMDEEQVVTEKGPFFLPLQPDSSATPCGRSSLRAILLLHWLSPAHRRAWTQNYLAHSYTWLGHITHAVGLGCSNVEASLFRVEEGEVVWSGKVDSGCEDSDDSDDMGF